MKRSYSMPLRSRFPTLLAWLNRRLDPHKQSGLRLTAVVLVAVGSAWLFAGLTQDVLAREEFAQADSVVNAAVVSHRVPWVSTTMLVVTWLGSAAVLVPVILLTTVYLTYIKPDVLSIVRLWLAYLGAAGLSELMKFLVNRPRPPNAERLMSVSDTAFPSSHATQVLAVWGMLAFLLMRRQRKRIRVTAFLGVVAVSLLVGFSRLYLGVHWLTDVVGGYALGAMWLAIVLIAGITASRALGQRR